MREFFYSKDKKNILRIVNFCTIYVAQLWNSSGASENSLECLKKRQRNNLIFDNAIIKQKFLTESGQNKSEIRIQKTKLRTLVWCLKSFDSLYKEPEVKADFLPYFFFVWFLFSLPFLVEIFFKDHKLSYRNLLWLLCVGN